MDRVEQRAPACVDVLLRRAIPSMACARPYGLREALARPETWDKAVAGGRILFRRSVGLLFVGLDHRGSSGGLRRQRHR